MTMSLKHLALALSIAALPSLAHAAVWTGSGQWASWSQGGYTIYADEWGSTAPMTIWANSGTQFGWSGNWSGGGVKAYPHNQKNKNRTNPRTAGIATVSGLSGPNNGFWGWTYDNWIPNEVMCYIWWTGAAQPWGSLVASNVSIGGRAYNVYVPSNNATTNFMAVSKYTSGNTDLGGLHNWVLNYGRGGSGGMTSVQFGSEPSSGNGNWSVGQSTLP